MAPSAWKKVKRALELLVWMGALGLVLFRLGPQLTAALGVAAGDEGFFPAQFRALDGSTFTAEDLRGKVVLVNAWATWCPPCVIEMPGFQRVYEDYKDRGFLVLGVSRDQGDPAEVEAFLRKRGITYPVAMDRDVDLGGITEVQTLPTSYLIGRDGTIRHRVEGLYLGPALRLAVRRLLDEG